ncbi:MAG: hypothetical protein KA731_00330 [Candidatus Moranbacteria bacterium]|nr:hypothetical protein [Candidatus Moranbacteria bacterium]MBP6033864.1 hypothetical protein [Candidatus Moranbacteria bacterium]MBP7695678.1 hypothetical protein [Candidatus Moranbacteria bacterium]
MLSAMGRKDEREIPSGETPQEMPRTPEEEQEPEIDHEIGQRIIDDIESGEDADRQHRDRVDQIIYDRDHRRTIH